MLKSKENIRIDWQGRKGSNSQPSVLETAVLPLELRPCRSEAHYIDEIVLCKGANQASFFKVEFQKKFKKNYFINQCNFKSRYFSAYILRV